MVFVINQSINKLFINLFLLPLICFHETPSELPIAECAGEYVVVYFLCVLLPVLVSNRCAKKNINRKIQQFLKKRFNI